MEIKYSTALGTALTVALFGLSGAAACSSSDAPDGNAGPGPDGGNTGGATTGSGGASKGGSTGTGGGSAGKGGSGKGGTTGTGGGGSSTGGTIVTGPPLPASCGFDAPAFCETFETAHPGGRGGEIDEKMWAFSRWNRTTSLWWTRGTAQSFPNEMKPVATFCGERFSGILPPNDVRACNGTGIDGRPSRMLNEVFDDQGDFAFHSFMTRQPFDFTGRTGTIKFDVDAKQNPYNLGHGWWIEVWITEDPTPMPYHEAPGSVFSYPRKGVGIQFQRMGGEIEHPADGSWWGNAVGRVVVVDNYRLLHDIPRWEFDDSENANFKTYDAKMNHLEIKLSQDKVEVFVSDIDDAMNATKRAVVTGLDLSFSRGYVHFQHSHYNAGKDGLPGCENGAPGTCPTPTQTYRWDNIGFDGPRYPVLRAYDVPDNDEPAGEDTLPARPQPEEVIRIGYMFTDEKNTYTFNLAGVDKTDATTALLNFNLFARTGRELEYKLNDGPTHTFTVPQGEAQSDADVFRTFTVEVPIAEVKAGNNTLTVHSPPPYQIIEGIGNIDLALQPSK